jgi:predicted RNA-binding Zn-ribbon protein involved in translation (DUF1610 family)
MSVEPDYRPNFIKCPKCGHEIQQDAGWLKVSSRVTCPVCLTLVIVRELETDGKENSN